MMIISLMIGRGGLKILVRGSKMLRRTCRRLMTILPGEILDLFAGSRGSDTRSRSYKIS